MSCKISKIFGIFLLWLIIILIKIFFPESIGKAQFNGYIIGITAIVCFFLYPNLKILIVSFVFLIVLLATSRDLIHPLGDFTIFITLICAYNLSLKCRFKRNELQIVSFCLLFFIIIDLLGLFIPNLYSNGIDGQRYDGLLHSGNVTATAFCLCQIAYYESCKNNSKNKIILLLSILSFILMLLLTKTRSMFFFLPYWFVQFEKKLNKYVIALALFSVIIIVINALAYIQTNLRLQGDSSSMTRAFLYEAMIEGIINNYAIFPHGSNEANTLSKYLTDDPNFAPHNDILQYIYDWGFMFFLVCGIMYKKLKDSRKTNLSYWCIVLGWLSGCLHNILILPQIYFIFIFASNLFFNNQTNYYDVRKQ